MPELPQHRLGDIERKVLTLYSLKRLGGCGNLQLIAFMTECDIMNYFDLQTALFDLRDAGQAARTPQAADDLYEITPAGEETLRLFASRAPASLMEAVDAQAPLYRERFLRQRERSARIAHEEGKEYHLLLQINEQRMPLIGIDLSLPTAELAARLRDRWEGEAQAIYDFIIARLSGEGEA